MTGEQVDARLRRLGKDRRWLAQATGYSWNTLRDCLAPASVKGISAKMAGRIEQALVTEEAGADPVEGDILANFNSRERREIAEHASREGYADPHSWIVAKIRALLAMMRVKGK